MTVFFGLLAVLGAAGALLLRPGRPAAPATFEGALAAADPERGELLRRLEALEARVAELEKPAKAARPAPAPRRAPEMSRPLSSPDLNGRLRAVMEAYERAGDPLKAARSLGTGTAEVELALKLGGGREAACAN